ncbi:MAG: c-type cytochrome biogenesis protein CcmI, partial [Rhodospirillales bacterium]|nr:c-type cytochrome biogenesis protein CcmI [Rhodospirillales bacterium]
MMIFWLACAVLAALVLLPLLGTLAGGVGMRGRRDAALALHRAQLGELDGDLAEGRIGVAEHGAAKLEVQRRLLAVGAETEAAGRNSPRGPILAVLLLVPIAAFALYVTGGSPGLPGAPLAERLAVQKRRAAEEDALIAQLRARLAAMPAQSEQARAGYVLLGNAEASRGRLPQAVAAWQVALAAHFEATLAAETAEAMSEAAGRVPPDAAA